MKKLKEVVDKQRDEIRAKDRELTLKNEDVEAVRACPRSVTNPYIDISRMILSTVSNSDLIHIFTLVQNEISRLFDHLTLPRSANSLEKSLICQQ